MANRILLGGSLKNIKVRGGKRRDYLSNEEPTLGFVGGKIGHQKNREEDMIAGSKSNPRKIGE